MAVDKTSKRLDMSDADIDALLKKASHEPLKPTEVDKLRHLIATLKYITHELDKKRVSIKKLQAMLFGHSSEKKNSPRLKDLLQQVAEAQTTLAEHDKNNAVGTADTNTEPQDAAKKETKSPKKGRYDHKLCLTPSRKLSVSFGCKTKPASVRGQKRIHS